MAAATVDVKGRRTTYTYDARGRLSTVTDPLGRVTSTTYDGAGQVRTTTDALGRVTTYTYDVAGQLVRTILPNGRLVLRTYDGAGRLVSVTAAGATTTYAYDDAGRVVTSTSTAGATGATVTRYDQAGRVVAVRRPDGTTVTSTYDRVGQLTDYTDAAGRATHYAYDVDGNRTAVTDTGGRTTGTAWVDGYASTVTTADGKTIGYVYDAGGHMVGVDYSDATPDVAYTYDAAGRRVGMVDGAGATSWVYGSDDTVTAVTGPQGDLAYTYDAVGRRTGLTYPGTTGTGGPRVVSYAYDDVDRLTGVGDWAGGGYAYSWNSDDQPATLTYPNGVVTTNTYDPTTTQLSRIATVKAGTTLLDLAYTYNAAQLVTGETSPGVEPGMFAQRSDITGRRPQKAVGVAQRSCRRVALVMQHMTLLATAPQNYGEVFTRRWVADVLLDLTGYTPDRDLGAAHLLEPSCGSGAFLGPVVERLLDSAKRHGHELGSLGDAVRAYDLQAEHVEVARQLCARLLLAAGASDTVAGSLAAEWVRHADFLLSGVEERLADVVIGNPPYIRYDDLADEVAAEYRRTWPTMRGRGDIYVGFFERGLQLLKPGGRIGYICADRWMRNQYGAPLRELVADRYSVEHIWTMHDVDAFEAQVSAYPAITVLANKPQGAAVVADTTAEFGSGAAFALAKAAEDAEFDAFEEVGVKAHRLPHWFAGGELWPTGSPARLALIEHLNDQFGPLHDPATGTKVSIGVATGADQVYVTKDPTVAEADRMTPLAMRRDLMTGTFSWQGNYLVNPWAPDGSLVALADYPRLSAYLSQHPKLRERHVAKKAPANWHRTIDKVHADLTDRPKLLLQDMKATIHPVLEPGGYYPHHNLYYVVSDTWDMEVLGGILLSRVAQAFIEAYCVRMRGGTLRFQAQYLKRIRVPAPDAVDDTTAKELRTAFRHRDVGAATEAAARAYNIDPKEYELV